MTPATDPYRTLGLPRGASLDEVKRAYRTLAKANHPDAAGPAALPRFLAIQAAYEQLLGGGVLPPPGSAPADPTRTRAGAGATHRAYGGRARRARPAGGPGPSSSGSGPSASGGARTRGSTGTTGAGSERAGTRPPSGAGAGAGPGSSTSSGAKDGGAPRSRGKATLGSTSYDGAEAGPFEPDWGGASWYGTTSGTYWTINPKEYADPRKHGPEYQARARRAARAQAGARGRSAASAGGTTADAAGLGAATDPDEAAAHADATGDPTARADAGRATHTTASWWETSIGAAPASSTEPDPFARPSAGGGRPPPSGFGSSGPGPSARAGRPADPGAVPPPPDLAAAATDLGRALTDERTAHGRWRLVQAVVAWLPIAFGLGWLAGEQTGCGRAAASCDGVDPLLGPVLALLALGVLLLVPRLAAIAAAGAIAAIVVAIPAAAVLSTGGDASPPDGRSIALGVILVAAWVVGLVLGIVRRLGAAPASPVRPDGPVS